MIEQAAGAGRVAAAENLGCRGDMFSEPAQQIGAAFNTEQWIGWSDLEAGG